MSLIRRTPQNLVAVAGAISRERGVPAPTVAKELLHAEILYCLMVSGAASEVVFQGGTALRLMYRGNRYSEDLDFAGGRNFDSQSPAIQRFTKLLKTEILAAYGLEVETNERIGTLDDDGVQVTRYQTRIAVPVTNVSLPQKQVINIEFANVPAHDAEVRPVQVPYEQVPAAFRTLLIPTESRAEIYADKVKALVARPFLKARDVWDLQFLRDGGVKLPPGMLAKKLADYGWTSERFSAAAELCRARLLLPETQEKFISEMRRFLDAPVANMMTPAFAARYLQAAINDIDQGLADLEAFPLPATATAERMG